MSQLSLLAESDRFARIDQRGDLLHWINRVVDWKVFRVRLEAVWRNPRAADTPGRKPWDVIVMFKVLVLCELYNLSDADVERQVDDRLTFTRFLGLGVEDRPPDEKTIWHYRAQLGDAELRDLMALFEEQLTALGYEPRGGQIIDATVVRTPKQKRTPTETRMLQVDPPQVPAAWTAHPPRARQKDPEAGWTLKGGGYQLGYKNHINVDRQHKLIREYAVTPASTHDSQLLVQLLAPPNTDNAVWADKAYFSAAAEQELHRRGLRSRILRRAAPGRPLRAHERHANRRNARVRARVEHVFGAQQNNMGGMVVRSVGLIRAQVRLGLKNLAYNIQRVVFLQRQAGALA